jgi:crotonobetainyl-CoA:carnitine CoA-transferase CaiB-like acyl-CoA transferase
MAGYLDSYGAGEEQRAKITRAIALWGGAAFGVAAILWFVFHFVIPNRAQQGEVKRFFQQLSAQNYKQAYALWGCTDEKPCPDYPLAAFMRDWGPQAVPTGAFEVLDGESCGSGVIVDIDAGKAGDKRIWVERKDGSFSFPPPGMDRCPQGNRIYDFFRNLRYRMRGRTYQ